MFHDILYFLMAHGQPGEAERLARARVESESELCANHFDVAYLLLRRVKYSESEAVHQKHLVVHPACAHARMWYAEFLQAQGRARPAEDLEHDASRPAVRVKPPFPLPIWEQHSQGFDIVDGSFDTTFTIKFDLHPSKNPAEAQFYKCHLQLYSVVVGWKDAGMHFEPYTAYKWDNVKSNTYAFGTILSGSKPPGSFRRLKK